MQIAEHKFTARTNIRSSFNKRRNTSDLYIHLSRMYHSEVDSKFKEKQILNVTVTNTHNKHIISFLARIVKVHSARDGKIYYIKIPALLEKNIEAWMSERESLKVHLDTTSIR